MTYIFAGPQAVGRPPLRFPYRDTQDGRSNGHERNTGRTDSTIPANERRAPDEELIKESDKIHGDVPREPAPGSSRIFCPSVFRSTKTSRLFRPAHPFRRRREIPRDSNADELKPLKFGMGGTGWMPTCTSTRPRAWEARTTTGFLNAGEQALRCLSRAAASKSWRSTTSAGRNPSLAIEDTLLLLLPVADCTSGSQRMPGAERLSGACA